MGRSSHLGSQYHLAEQLLNNSCRLATQEGLNRLKQIKSILESRRDELPGHSIVTLELPQDHENIRGPQSFH